MSARAYPLPRPENGQDPRFTLGLTLDVAKVIEAAGYPAVTGGVDFVDLQQALFRFIYGAAVLDEDQPTSQPAAPARGHDQDNTYTHAMTVDGALTPRCGGIGTVALFVYNVNCPRCLAMLAGQAREEAAEESCRRCRVRFDPSDRRFDGHGRWHDSPWCGGCVDRCYDSADPFHSCAVCKETGR